jgi:hypothetical protein
LLGFEAAAEEVVSPKKPATYLEEDYWHPEDQQPEDTETQLN